MHGSVLDLFKFNTGRDITKQLDRLNIDSTILACQKVYLRNLFLVGRADNRQSPQCLFANNILLALLAIMVAIISFKNLASINFSAARAPEDYDRFDICQMPCYTEGDVSLCRTIDSLAQIKDDEKRKLLLVICDGMTVGSGNDRPTPRIALDILWILNLLASCRWEKKRSSIIWARCVLGCMNVRATSFRISSLSRWANRLSVRGLVIVVNVTRRCC